MVSHGDDYGKSRPWLPLGRKVTQCRARSGDFAEGGAAIFSNFAGLDLQAMPSLTGGKATAHRAPLVIATPESLRGYGRTVAEFAREPVAIVTWPQPGWRPIVPGTGNEGGVAQDRFVMERRGEVQHAVNRAVGRSYVTGWFADPAIASEGRAAADTSRIYTHEANYHPDGGQVFAPRDHAAFVALLAKAGDDVQPADFVAFYCMAPSASISIQASGISRCFRSARRPSSTISRGEFTPVSPSTFSANSVATSKCL